MFVRALEGGATTWEQATASPRDKLVVFMTLWCAPCKAEQPEVEAWARAHASTHDTLLVVSGSPLGEAQQMARDRRVAVDDLAVWVDSAGDVAAHYGVESTPTLLWLAPDGSVRAKWHHIADVVVDTAAEPLEPVTDSGEELGTSYDVVLLAPAASRG
ncbi:MAG: TlpA disulfide reductase family protein, partial [Myxococcota bacterium]